MSFNFISQSANLASFSIYTSLKSLEVHLSGL